MKFEVSQTLWLVPAGRWERPREVMVKKVGRKWAHLSNGDRVEVATGRVDYAYGAGPSLYDSREEWEAHVRVQDAWWALRKRIEHGAPAGMTIERILQAAELLGVSVEQPNA